MRLSAVLYFLVPLYAQLPAYRPLLEAENARETGAPALVKALSSDYPRTQQLAARALGRLENPAYRDVLIPLLKSKDPAVRISAASAMAQMKAPWSWNETLGSERDPAVRAVIYEAIGRAKPPSDDAGSLLAAGLTDPNIFARTGAARGLDSLFRLNYKAPRKPALATTAAIHAVFEAHPDAEMRELLLLAMNTVTDRDPAIVATALADPSPQVRRAAVTLSRQWRDDPDPYVRYEALRVAPTCERAATAVNDANGLVALFAIDQLGKLKCPAPSLLPLVDAAKPWRIRAHAVAALALADPEQARPVIARMTADPIWQVRAWVANAARTAQDQATLTHLARDPEPNVAIAALTTTDDALYAIATNHSGLILAGAQRLKGTPDLKDHLPQLTAAYQRLTATGVITARDPRVELLNRIGETHAADDLLKDALKDRDPAITAIAARFLNGIPATTKLPVPSLPSADYIRNLDGAAARITMRGLGVMTVDLLTGEAPVSAATFSQLAEAGQYNGLTIHRIAATLIQGGSPGADEYDARSKDFMRDELGLTRNLRGTMGTSTRGRDTGDAQIYFNTVDNFRLDRDYTIFAQIRDGLAVLDRIQEGDIIDRVEILRHNITPPPAEFEVASLKPSAQGTPFTEKLDAAQFVGTAHSLMVLLMNAYPDIEVQPWKVSGGPAWLNTDRWDFAAKLPAGMPTDQEQLYRQTEAMLRNFLASQFQLKTHRETREFPVYALVPAKSGPKLRPSEVTSFSVKRGPGRLEFRHQSIAGLIAYLYSANAPVQMAADRPVVDHTGIEGFFDFTLEWTPDGALSDPALSGPSIFTAVEQQLGLKLQPVKAPVEFLVVDHAERPGLR